MTMLSLAFLMIVAMFVAQFGFRLEVLEAALALGRPQIFNTDQGVQYTAAAFTGRARISGQFLTRSPTPSVPLQSPPFVSASLPGTANRASGWRGSARRLLPLG